MSNAPQKYRLLTQNEATVAIVQIADAVNDTEKLFEAISNSPILHRSLYRDYYSMFMAAPSPNVSPEHTGDFFEVFARRFLRGEYDFLISSHPQRIAQEKGWPNVLGWDKVTNKIAVPLTNLFKIAAVHAHDVHQFFLSGKENVPGRDPYQNIVMKYVSRREDDDFSIFSTVIQAQAQVAELSIRVREKFEQLMGRPQRPDDWDKMESQMCKMLLRMAASPRLTLFNEIATIAHADDPLNMSAEENGCIRLRPTSTVQSAVEEYMRDTEGEDFFERYKGSVPTGCPVVFSVDKEGGRPSYLAQVFGVMLKAVRKDFWPEDVPQKALAEGCPFHSRGVA